ncbi:MAG: TolC family protein [Myxococcales bacterium]|nr:TolC family protein [Myxococcales bacterium]
MESDLSRLPQGSRLPWLLAAAGLVMGTAGCATETERAAESDLRRQSDALAEQRRALPKAPRHARREGLGGDLETWVQRAMRDSPELRAAYQAYRAKTLHIARARRLPDPVLTYGYYIRSVETRVGPQRHRFGLRQMLPWPGSLSAGSDAVAAEARAEARMLEAARLGLRLRVARAFYALWRVRQQRIIEAEQRALLEQLAESASLHMSTGHVSLPQVLQLNLAVTRRTDRLAALGQQERAAQARLLAAVGAEGDAISGGVGIDDGAVRPEVPALELSQLRERALRHPRIRRYDELAEARDAAGEKAGADALPSFTLGVDYIETGEAMQSGVPDSGKDPIMAMVSVSLPIFGGSYDREQEAVAAEAAAMRARGDQARDERESELIAALAEVEDSARRIDFNRSTLVPQAQAAFESTATAYTTGRGSVASTLLSHRDLLEIQQELIAAQHDHAVAWATLEELVGEALARRPLR